MGLNRRVFLQQTGLLLSALGLSEAGLVSLAGRYQQALAQPTRRKLALLVGINQYPEGVCDSLSSSQSVRLRGSLTDLELQRQLLMSRFGFQPSDIVTLTDEKATYQAITDAFIHHLSDQARAGDVVVFHFSGYGSQVKLIGDQRPSVFSLVPVDGKLPTEAAPMVNDLLVDTLSLLLQTLRTNQVTTVVDCGSADLGRLNWGSLKVRSRPEIPTGEISSTVTNLHGTLMGRIKGIKGDTVNPRMGAMGALPGVVLQAADPEQIVVEGAWPDFSAGVFTYTLTQQLWNLCPPATLRFAMGRATESIQMVSGVTQHPRILGQRQGETPLSPYNLAISASTTADGVITEVSESGKRCTIWLGGISTPILEHYGNQSSLTLALDQPTGATPSAGIVSTVPSEPDPASSVGARRRPLLKIQARDGLSAQAVVKFNQSVAPQVGQRVYEVSRILPRNIELTVALDRSLERIERVDATSALSGIPFVSSILAGEQPADCLFGHLDEDDTTLTAALPNQSRTDVGLTLAGKNIQSEAGLSQGYGLFSPSRELIPGTVAKGEEAIKTAISRLTPQLEVLLAAKQLRMTDNQGSSQLAVRASLELTGPQERLVMQQETVRSPQVLPKSRLASLFTNGERPTQVPIGGRLRYRLSNFGDRPLYYALMGFDSRGRAFALYPNRLGNNNSEDALIKQVAQASKIAPGDIGIVPQSGIDWITDAASNWVETHLVFSIQPLYATVSALWQQMKANGNSGRVSALGEPLAIAEAILEDVQQASLSINPDSVPQDSYRFDIDAWASLSFVYEVVAKHGPV